MGSTQPKGSQQENLSQSTHGKYLCLTDVFEVHTHTLTHKHTQNVTLELLEHKNVPKITRKKVCSHLRNEKKDEIVRILSNFFSFIIIFSSIFNHKDHMRNFLKRKLTITKSINFVVVVGFVFGRKTRRTCSKQQMR